MAKVALGEITVQAEDVEYSDYYPSGAHQGWEQICGLLLPLRPEPLLTVEMKNRKRYRFEGGLANGYADQLTEAGVPVFRHH